MRFNSESERLKHPQARLIPRIIWIDDFNEMIDERDLSFMSLQNGDAQSKLNELKNGKFNDSVTKRLFLCIALGNANLSPNELIDLGQSLYKATTCCCLLTSLGRSDVFDALYTRFPEHITTLCLGSLHFFETAVCTGNIEILSKIKAIASKEKDETVTHYRSSFQLAALSGHLAMVQLFFDEEPEQRLSMLQHEHYRGLKSAAKYAETQVVNYLASFFPKIVAQVLCDCFQEIAEFPAESDATEALNLLNYPPVYAFAEAQPSIYPSLLNRFFEQKIQSLQRAKTALEQEDPKAVFTPDANDLKLCFYLLRQIIRQKNPSLDNTLLFLLNIPSVRDLVHQEMTPGQSNELLRLSLSTENLRVAILLLTIPAVEALAKENDYYGVGEGIDAFRKKQSGLVSLFRKTPLAIDFGTQDEKFKLAFDGF